MLLLHLGNEAQPPSGVRAPHVARHQGGEDGDPQGFGLSAPVPVSALVRGGDAPVWLEFTATAMG